MSFRPEFTPHLRRGRQVRHDRKTMRVVIDTNILINAAGDENSYAFRIINGVIAGRLEAFATHQTMSENRQMLRKLVKEREYRILLEDFFRRLKIVKVYERLRVVTDEEDNKLLESAVASGADYLITADREVLDIGEYHGTKVVTPQEFWAKYQSDDDSKWGEWSRMVMGK